MIEEKVKAGMPENTRLLGSIGDRIDLFCRERASSEESWNTACRESVDAFINKLDDLSGLHGLWQGEFWGKWILGAIDVCEYTKDEKLRAFISKSIDEIISLQEPSGYIGTYRNPNFLVSGNPKVIFKVFNWNSTFNWNIWSRKYTLWGLVEGYRLLNDAKILESAIRLADQTLDTFDVVKLKIWETGTFSGLPSCSIMKPLLQLYRFTGTQRYLDFAVEIADFWENKDPRTMPRLISNAMSGIPVGKWYNLYTDDIWTKSYEMMSCFEGLLELYSITGVEKYLECTEKFWELIDKYELNVFYGMGINDHLTGGKDYPNAITEPCDNIHYMRLCHDLFRYTGKVRYINRFENNFLNAFLAGIYEDGKWGARGVRSSRRHFQSPGQCNMKYNHCCVNNMPRACVTAAKTAVMTDNENVYINFYTPFASVVNIGGKSAKISVSGSYLVDGKVTITIDRDADWNGNILFRLPEWAVGTTAVVNGKEIFIDESKYSKLELSAQENVCNIAFDLQPELGNTGVFSLPVSDDQWHNRRWHNWEFPEDYMISTPHSFLHYGPLTLARSIRLGTAAEELFTNKGIEVESCTLTPIESDGTLAAFEAVLKTPQGEIKTRFCDYASAGNWQGTDDNVFNVYF